MASEKCDLLILSASYGGGHNQVAKAISEAWQRQCPELTTTTADYCQLLQPLIGRLSQFSYYRSLRHFPLGYAWFYKATGNIAADSFWQRRVNRLGYTEVNQLLQRLRPRLIVATFPMAAGVLAQLKATGELTVPLVTVVTDFCVHSQWIHPGTDLYIVGAEEVAKGLVKRGVDPDRVVVTGIPIRPVFHQQHDLRRIRAQYGLEEEDRVVLFMGGSEGRFSTERFDYLLGELPPQVKTLVFTGFNDQLYQQLKPLRERLPNLRVLKYVENISGLMDLATLLVTKAGGVTISEALVKGLPMIIYKSLPGHEMVNTDFLWRHRAAVVVNKDKSLKRTLDGLLGDDRFREQLRSNCLKLAYPGSAEAGVAAIQRLFFSKPQRAKYQLPNQSGLRSELRA